MHLRCSSLAKFGNLAINLLFFKLCSFVSPLRTLIQQALSVIQYSGSPAKARMQVGTTLSAQGLRMRKALLLHDYRSKDIVPGLLRMRLPTVEIIGDCTTVMREVRSDLRNFLGKHMFTPATRLIN